MANEQPPASEVKLEHLPSVPDSHDELIRLFSFDAEEAAALMTVVSDWLRDPSAPLQVDTLPFVTRVNCAVRFELAPKDDGIQELSPYTYVCRMTVDSFKAMLELMSPFAKGGSVGHQWLHDMDTPIDLLFSRNGSW
jgi:hypothetical protein